MKRSPGFTLIEVMIALALTIIVIGMAFSMLLVGIRDFKGGQTDVEGQQSLRIAMNRITRMIRMRDPGVNRIGVEAGDTLFVYSHGSRVSYYLRNGNLMEKIDGGSNQLCNQVTTFEPRYEDGCVHVTLGVMEEGESEEARLSFKIYVGEEYP